MYFLDSPFPTSCLSLHSPSKPEVAFAHFPCHLYGNSVFQQSLVHLSHLLSFHRWWFDSSYRYFELSFHSIGSFSMYGSQDLSLVHWFFQSVVGWLILAGFCAFILFPYPFIKWSCNFLFHDFCAKHGLYAYWKDGLGTGWNPTFGFMYLILPHNDLGRILFS